MKFLNKTILITGASSGIGKAFALRAAKDKCTLILAARRIDKLKELKTEIESLGSTAELVQTDVTKDGEVKNLLSKASSKGRVLDLVFNNAGVLFVKPIYELTSDEIHQIIDTNLTGMIMVTKSAAEVMIKQNHGHIIMTSSMAGLVPIPQWSVYCATKWGITGFADSIRPELKKYNVKITTLHPGVVYTPLYDKNKANISMDSLGGIKNSLKPMEVAEEVYKNAFTNTWKIRIPKSARIYGTLYKYFPKFITSKIEKIATKSNYKPSNKIS